MFSFLDNQYLQYTILIDTISDDIDLKLVKFYVDKMFELLKWVNDTAVIKRDIASSAIDYHDFAGSENNKVAEIEKLYRDKDFENEYDELKKLTARIKIQIKKISSSL